MLKLARHYSSRGARVARVGRRRIIAFAVAAAGAGSMMFSAADAAGRSRAGLQALYDFRSQDGDVVEDRAKAGEPIHLKIENPEAVRRANGSLEVVADTVIRADDSSGRLTEAIRKSGELTVEAWIRPADTGLTGPARIVTLSKNGSERNFTVGQDGDRFEVRLRTTRASTNGMPSLPAPEQSVAAERTHIVYTRDRGGRACLYVNGEKRAENRDPGSTSNWDGSARFALANELSGDRPWRGSYYLVAIYSRSLLPFEVARHFEAGLDVDHDVEEGADVAGARLFDEEIAPLLARHCLECHDSSNRKGKLDLSRKETTLAGGNDGPAIVPGKPEGSLLWELVESGEMPDDRPVLSQNEKDRLREWIEAGAPWTSEVIDPLAHKRDGRTGQNWVRRLTLREYIETVRSVTGVDIAAEARELLPADLRADGFSNTAYNLNVDLEHVDAYARLAKIIVSRMNPGQFSKEFDKKRRFTDDDKGELISNMGRWILRGPVEDHEIIAYRGIATAAAAAGGTYEDSVALIIQAMLQSPRFLYRIEKQLGDGSPWPVDAYELASRMSYIIWGSPPDRELMRAAEKGELHERDRLAGQIQRMLEDPRAVEHSIRFIEEWLDLDRLENLQPSRERYPHWDPELAADMREETREYFREVVWEQKRPLASLFNTKVAFLTPRLARHYGLEYASADGDPGRVERHDLSGVKARGGLLTQGSILTVGGDDASMVTRGLFVLHDVLRGGVKDPPPGTDTTPVPSEPGRSQRAVSEERIANQNCGGCHSKFEPLAFGLERFDGLGAYRETDAFGNALREDGEVLIPGEAEATPYDSVEELMDFLASNERVQETLTWKAAQFALGRPLVGTDEAVLKEIHRETQEKGATYQALIAAIVMSDMVQMTRTEPAE
ncbi:MAG TPA: DUF1592 domain-containing protein [Verrucomicrobiales bacterium]|nr:DUF1592 domain-containing protein [Verrucomicrobiales bacterium]